MKSTSDCMQRYPGMRGGCNAMLEMKFPTVSKHKQSYYGIVPRFIACISSHYRIVCFGTVIAAGILLPVEKQYAALFSAHSPSHPLPPTTTQSMHMHTCMSIIITGATAHHDSGSAILIAREQALYNGQLRKTECRRTYSVGLEDSY